MRHLLTSSAISESYRCIRLSAWSCLKGDCCVRNHITIRAANKGELKSLKTLDTRTTPLAAQWKCWSAVDVEALAATSPVSPHFASV